jgi:hypothetical protein
MRCLYIISFVNANGLLVDNKRAMGYRAAALREIYFLVVNVMSEGDLGIQFLGVASHPALRRKTPVEKIWVIRVVRPWHAVVVITIVQQLESSSDFLDSLLG